jgi:hypothetical protein
MNQSYSPIITCSNVHASCERFTFTTCLWYQLLASPSRNCSTCNTCSLSRTSPLYCSTLNNTTRLVSQFSSSLNLRPPWYLPMESLSVLRVLVPWGSVSCTIRCCHMSLHRCSCMLPLWCSVASCTLGVLCCVKFAGGMVYPHGVWLLQMGVRGGPLSLPSSPPSPPPPPPSPPSPPSPRG